MKPSLRRCHRRSANAFSLIEIIVALAIVSLMVAGVVGLIKGNVPAARITRADDDIRAIAAQLEAYQATTGSYPSTEQGLKALVEKPTVEPIPDRWQQFIKRLPLDPWKTPYQYRYPGLHDPDGYDLYSLGPDKKEGADDITNWKEEEDGHATAANGAGN